MLERWFCCHALTVHLRKGGGVAGMANSSPAKQAGPVRNPLLLTRPSVEETETPWPETNMLHLAFCTAPSTQTSPKEHSLLIPWLRRVSVPCGADRHFCLFACFESLPLAPDQRFPNPACLGPFLNPPGTSSPEDEGARASLCLLFSSLLTKLRSLDIGVSFPIPPPCYLMILTGPCDVAMCSLGFSVLIFCSRLELCLPHPQR